MERGPLSFGSTTEEHFVRNSSDSGLENVEYDRGDLLSRPCDTLYPQKLALTSGGGSVGKYVSGLRPRSLLTWTDQISLIIRASSYKYFSQCVAFRHLQFASSPKCHISAQLLDSYNRSAEMNKTTGPAQWYRRLSRCSRYTKHHRIPSQDVPKRNSRCQIQQKKHPHRTNIKNSLLLKWHN
jgi:hypothetical protein